MSPPHRTLKLKVELLGYWLAGTAGGDAATVDVACNRDSAGLPYLPGRTLKGLLRHAAADLVELGHAESAEVARLFGRGLGSAGASGEMNRYDTEPGSLHVGSARLPAEWRAWAVTPEGRAAVPHLFDSLSSTALDQGGRAKDATLRTVEVAVPMTLQAEVTGEMSPSDLALLRRAAGLVRGVGRSRTRGLGRARIAIEEVGG